MILYVLAGGKASRLGRESKFKPKVLMDVNGFPFIHYLLSYYKGTSVNKVVFLIDHLGEQIERWIKDWGEKYGFADVSVIYDGFSKGTYSAIKSALISRNQDASELCLVTYGDTIPGFSLTPFIKFAIESGSPLVLSGIKEGIDDQQANLFFKNGKWKYLSDPNKDTNNYGGVRYVEYGIMALTRSAIESQERVSDLKEFIHLFLNNQDIEVYTTNIPCVEIGTPISLDSFRKKLSNS